MTTISVIAIFYNSEAYMRKCIDSILNQQNVNLELIGVDDCSKDNTLEILQLYSKKDKRVRVIHHDKNKGISEARNSGIKAMTGDCFYLIDGDDSLPDDALWKLTEKYSEDVDWVQGGYSIVDEQNNLLRIRNNVSNTYRNHQEIVDNFWQIEFIYTHNRLINKKFKDILFPTGKAHEDRFWNIEAFPLVNKIINISDSTYNYTAHTQSFSNKSRCSSLYIDSALELLEKMDKSEECWKNESDTFLITAIEKNLYLWKQKRKYRKLVLNKIRKRSGNVTLSVNGFPRFNKIIHLMIAKGYPDFIISQIGEIYRAYVYLTNKPV